MTDEGARHERQRCPWVGDIAEFVPYHDEEWGFPVADDIRLFEKMSLETFQAGLSWRTILNKREAFRRAFAGFDPARVASFSDADVERLLEDASIIRHRGKIEAVINNAAIVATIADTYGSLAAFVWRYEPAPEDRPQTLSWETLRGLSKTTESAAMARDLKEHGWRFFGPTTAYAFMQSMGIVNDHVEECFCRPLVAEARAAFPRPC